MCGNTYSEEQNKKVSQLYRKYKYKYKYNEHNLKCNVMKRVYRNIKTIKYQGMNGLFVMTDVGLFF